MVSRQYSADLTFTLKEYAFREQIHMYGVADAEPLNQEPKGRRPIDLLPDAKAVIVVAMGMHDPLMKMWYSLPGSYLLAAQNLPDALINLWLLKLLSLLKDYGYAGAKTSGEFIPGLRLNRAAQQAGLGYIGKSQLLITPEFGPRVFLGALVTNAPLLPDSPCTENQCGPCKVCQEYCPSGAIQEGFYDARKCESYINQVSHKQVFSLYGWSECAMCMRICPKGRVKWPKEPGKWPDWVARNREIGLPWCSRHDPPPASSSSASDTPP